jgi:hypothetical protein
MPAVVFIKVLIHCFGRNQIYYTHALLLLVGPDRVVISVAQQRFINTFAEASGNGTNVAAMCPPMLCAQGWDSLLLARPLTRVQVYFAHKKTPTPIGC